jgi:hypothetical protein
MKSSIFFTADDEQYRMLHHQDCCEDVYVEDIIGDVDDLIGSPIIEAREATGCEDDDVEEVFRQLYDDEDLCDAEDGWISLRCPR